MQSLLVLSGQKLRNLQKHVLVTIFSIVFKDCSFDALFLIVSVSLFKVVIFRLNSYILVNFTQYDTSSYVKFFLIIYTC